LHPAQSLGGVTFSTIVALLAFKSPIIKSGVVSEIKEQLIESEFIVMGSSSSKIYKDQLFSFLISVFMFYPFMINLVADTAVPANTDGEPAEVDRVPSACI